MDNLAMLGIYVTILAIVVYVKSIIYAKDMNHFMNMNNKFLSIAENFESRISRLEKRW